MSLLLVNNVYDWFKDGNTKLDELTFKSDGTYTTTVTSGVWKTTNEMTLLLTADIKNKGTKTTFKVHFNEDGSEGILIVPRRTPATKMII